MMPWILRFDVADQATLDALRVAPLSGGLQSGVPERHVHRDLYFDTGDGELERRGINCRLRHDCHHGRLLAVTMWDPDRTRVQAASQAEIAVVPDTDLGSILAGASGPARLLQAVVDPARLGVEFEVDTDRWLRTARWWRWPSTHCTLAYDSVTIRQGGVVAHFQRLKLAGRSPIGPGPGRLGRSLVGAGGVVPAVADKLRRGREIIRSHERHSFTGELVDQRRVVVLPYRDGLLGLLNQDGRLIALSGAGAGEPTCRKLLHAAFGTAQAQVRLLGSVPAKGTRGALDVWLARRIPGTDVATGSDTVAWASLNRLAEVVGTRALDDPETLAALHLAVRSDLLLEQPAWEPGPQLETLPPPSLTGSRSEELPYTNADLSLLAFQERVLALAQDDRASLPDRLRYLAIVGANLDEFFMVRVAALARHAAKGADPGPDRMPPADVLDAVRIRARTLTESAYRCLVDDIQPALHDRGVRVCRWADVDPAGRDFLSKYFRERILPLLTPLAAAPGHPFPHIASFHLSLAVMVRQPTTGARHLATVVLPPALPRFIPLPAAGQFIPLEAAVCAHVQGLFAGVTVERAHAFRVTRGADIQYDEGRERDLLQAVEEQVARRPFEPVVRLEVERTMPVPMRELLLQEFRFEVAGRVSDLGHADVHEYEWLAGLRTLRDLADRLAVPVARSPRLVFAADAPVFMQLDAGDVLVHFPYDSFADSAERFLVEAADDPAVAAIKLTLYRTDDQSEIRGALLRAAASGKSVVVVMEVKARFDEEHNIAWAKELRTAGVHVSHGLPGLKTHAKVALVVRHDGELVRRYAFIGTGNFHAVTATLYTDFGLFTTAPEIGEEINALFNNLTGLAADRDQQRLLVAPEAMLPRLLELIAREAAHAQAGRPARLRAKLNGLDDPDLIAALYAASRQGVIIELIVRGICSLQPGLPGVSDRIRVVSILGPLLEHARVLHVANGGADEYFIGSADWRMRNLRRRVEVYAPVASASAVARLDEELTRELEDVTAWELYADGVYRRRVAPSDDVLGVQERRLREWC